MGELGSTGDSQPVVVNDINKVNGVIYFSPENIDFYVVVRATVTVPLANVKLIPSQLQVQAERIRYVNGAVTLAGDTDSFLLYLVGDGDGEGDGPQLSADGNSKTFLYRSHPQPDPVMAQGSTQVAGANDWHITKKMGRWRLRLIGVPSNPVEFKINKRYQIVKRARDWAALNLPDNEYPQGSGVPWPCGAFTDRLIYERLGLPSNTDLDSSQTAPDDGKGSLVFFWGKGTVAGKGHASHVAIKDGYERIDTNAILHGEPPTVRGLRDFANDYLPEPLFSYWGTIVTGSPKNQNTGKSILKELDSE